MKHRAVDNVIQFPTPARKRALPDPDRKTYPATFAKVLLMHIGDNTKQANRWAPSRASRFGTISVGLLLFGLGAAVAAVFL